MMTSNYLETLKKYVNDQAYRVFSGALTNCEHLRENAIKVSNEILDEYHIPRDQVCLIAVGSLGRSEALQASDIDLIPIIANKKLLEGFKECDRALRKAISEKLGVKVSKGEDLTRADHVNAFASPSLIGSDEDNVSNLTKRILILTESISIGGELEIRTVRDEILKGYSGMDRTRGRHVLSLVNDIARYFRTLCIEYKGKVDGDQKDWSTRNMKLRYSRKFWYFANLISICSIAEKHPRGERAYEDELLTVFSIAPYMRLLNQIGATHPVESGRILECFSVFLEFMSCPKRREALSGIAHDQRYSIDLGNPFPALKYNSDLMHSYMVDMLNGMSVSMRRRVIDWFLL